MAGGDHGDVPSTLLELERKLRELDRELHAPRHPDPAAAAGPASAAASGPNPPASPPTASPAPEPPASPDARAPATRRLVREARERIDGLHEQLEDLLRFRDQLAEAAGALVADYTQALEHLAAAGGQAAPQPAPQEAVLHGHVTVTVGPFGEHATLSGFERALGLVPGAAGVYVRGFEGDRAVIDVHLADPVALAAELRSVVPQPFVVDAAGEEHLTLTLRADPR